jgi:PKD repeat protein
MKINLVSIISLFLIIVLFATNNVAQPPTIVKGYVYIDNLITEPDEVHLTFSSQSRVGSVYSDGRYIIVFTGEDDGNVGEFYIIYNGKSYIPSETVTIIENQFIYEIDLYIETSDGGKEPPDEPVDPTNIQPKAISGGPYYEIIGEPIFFDASESYDSDGTIKNYQWDFGDDITSSGESTSHSYSAVGNYRVTLTVTDDKGKSDLDITYAYITETPNDPPSQPLVNGPQGGSVNILYNYTVFSTDIENNSIQYVFDWGDKTNITSSHFLDNGTTFKANHSWEYPGIYIVTVYAIDENNVVSKTTKINVLIDSIFCVNIGYMIDYTSDGFYDLFYSNSTGEESILDQDGDFYLIDEDNNGNYDYKYNFKTNTLEEFSEIKTESEKSTNILNNIQFIVVIIIIFILILSALFYYLKIVKKSDKKKDKRKEKFNFEKVKKERGKSEDILNENNIIEDEIDKILENKK